MTKDDPILKQKKSHICLLIKTCSCSLHYSLFIEYYPYLILSHNFNLKKESEVFRHQED